MDIFIPYLVAFFVFSGIRFQQILLSRRFKAKMNICVQKVHKSSSYAQNFQISLSRRFKAKMNICAQKVHNSSSYAQNFQNSLSRRFKASICYVW